jgi:hypothetical protein
VTASEQLFHMTQDSAAEWNARLSLQQPFTLLYLEVSHRVFIKKQLLSKLLCTVSCEINQGIVNERIIIVLRTYANDSNVQVVR